VSADSRRRVCMFLYTPFRHDSRVLNEATALVRCGHEVRVIATLEPGAEPLEERDGVRIERLDADPLPSKAARRVIELGGRLRRGSGASRGTAGVAAAPPSPGSLVPPAGGGLVGQGARVALRAHLSLTYAKYLRRARRAAAAEPAAVWWAHDLDTLPVAVDAKRRLRGAVVYDSHELFVETIAMATRAKVTRRAWRLAERRLIGASDRVVTTTQAAADELVRRYAVARPTVVRNLRDPTATGEPVVDRPPGSAPGGHLPRELDLPAQSKLALYVGGLSAGRGLEEMIQGAAHLDGVFLGLMGPSHEPYLQALKSLAARHGVAERIRFIPPVEARDVVRCASTADLGIVPIRNTCLNYYLSLPTKLFECIAAGLPVVTSDFPEMRRVVEEHRIGATCDPDLPADIARAVKWVLDEPERHEQLRANARRAARSLTWEREQTKLTELLRGLVPAGAGRHASAPPSGEAAPW